MVTEMSNNQNIASKELRSQYRACAPLHHSSSSSSSSQAPFGVVEDDDRSINSNLSIASDVDAILNTNSLVELHSKKTKERNCTTSWLMFLGSCLFFILGMGFLVAIVTNDPTFCPKVICSSNTGAGGESFDMETMQQVNVNATQQVSDHPTVPEITTPNVACRQDQIDRDGGLSCYDVCDELLCCGRNDCRGGNKQCESYKACFQTFPEVYMAMVPPGNPIPATANANATAAATTSGQQPQTTSNSQAATASTPAAAVENLEIDSVCSIDRLRADGGETCLVLCDTMTCCSDRSCDADAGFVCKDFEDYCVLNFPDTYHLQN